MSRTIILPVVLLSLFVTNVAAQSAIEKVIPPNLLPQLLALNRDLPTSQYPKYLSPADLAASSDGKYIYVALQQMKQVAQFDCASNRVVKYFLFPMNLPVLQFQKMAEQYMLHAHRTDGHQDLSV